MKVFTEQYKLLTEWLVVLMIHCYCKGLTQLKDESAKSLMCIFLDWLP